MKKSYVRTALLVLLFLQLVSRSQESSVSARAAHQVTPAEPTATLRAAAGATITFWTQNGRTVDDVPPQAWEMPHLVLYRNGALTDAEERTLIVELTDIEVPPTGVTVTIQVETQHGDPDLGADANASARISVWRESQWVSNTSGVTQTDGAAVFAHVFTATVNSGAETIATPTDYFRYDIAVIDAQHSITNPLNAFSADHALLMENQWTARLPEVQEASDGAAPDELTVYYCDMFPFHRNMHDSATWLPRDDVPNYVQQELVPQMIEAFRLQTDHWRFPWYDAWTSWRSGEDAERLSVALTYGRTWFFHGAAPSRGNSQISVKVSGGENISYDTLTDGLMSSFHHELFHNLQRNIHQKNGGDGRVSGELNSWRFFSEGTAVLASSIGQPLLQFRPGASARAYMSNANYFLKDAGHVGDLNTSYERLYPYRAALYWRFIYEQCGGTEDPAFGMQVIRRTLEVLFSGDIVEINSSTALVENLPAIMDQAFEGSLCPFKTHEESLVAFARAIYALRLDNGRCTEAGGPSGCGFYDPHDVHREPPVDTVTYSGTAVTYSAADQPFPAGIKSSFGMDFVDVILDPAADGKHLTLELFGTPGADAEFYVQLLTLMDSGAGTELQPTSTPTSTSEILTRTNADGHLIHVIPAINISEYNRLGLIITRVDSKENSDPIGAYNIMLHSGTEKDSDHVRGG